MTHERPTPAPERDEMEKRAKRFIADSYPSAIFNIPKTLTNFALSETARLRRELDEARAENERLREQADLSREIMIEVERLEGKAISRVAKEWLDADDVIRRRTLAASQRGTDADAGEVTK